MRTCTHARTSQRGSLREIAIFSGVVTNEKCHVKNRQQQPARAHKTRCKVRYSHGAHASRSCGDPNVYDPCTLCVGLVSSVSRSLCPKICIHTNNVLDPPRLALGGESSAVFVVRASVSCRAHTVVADYYE